MTATRRKRGRPPKNPQPEPVEEPAMVEEPEEEAPATEPEPSLMGADLVVAKGAICTRAGVRSVGQVVELRELSPSKAEAEYKAESLIKKGYLKRG